MESPANDAHAVRMSIVLCGVDDTEAGTTVMTAAKAAAERAGTPLVLTHVSTSHWGANVPAFHADAGATERVVEHGPPAQRILAVADGHGAELIVLGTRAKRWGSVARHVAKRANCPVMIVGPAADPAAEPVTRTGFDRAVLRCAPTPVVVLPAA
jgi:nucleotide-binding universal stress UspA family protein